MKKMIKAINVMDKIAMALDAIMITIAVLLLFLSDNDIWMRLTVLALSINVWMKDYMLAIERSSAKAEGDDNDNDT